MQTRVRQPWLWVDFIYYLTPGGREFKKSLDILHGFTRKVINERNADYASHNFSQKRIAFLDILLKANHEDNSLTFDDIQDEVDTFMFEGHDTTAAALSWAVHLIGSHPDVQKKLHEEVDSVFGWLN
jgi:cytochrome P450 family 4 subfamily V